MQPHLSLDASNLALVVALKNNTALLFISSRYVFPLFDTTIQDKFCYYSIF